MKPVRRNEMFRSLALIYVFILLWAQMNKLKAKSQTFGVKFLKTEKKYGFDGCFLPNHFQIEALKFNFP